MGVRKIFETTKNIEGWLSRQEGFFLYQLAGKVKGAVVEIGSWKGKSTIWLAGGAKKIYAIDPHIGSPEKKKEYGRVNTFLEFKKNIEASGFKNRIVPIVKTSDKAAESFHHPIGLLFIDGSHIYEDVKKDLTLWLPKVRRGGWVLIHDASVLSGPWKAACKFILFSSRFQNIGMVGSIIFGRYLPDKGWKKAVNLFKNFLSFIYILMYMILRRFPFPRRLRYIAKRRNFKKSLKSAGSK